MKTGVKQKAEKWQTSTNGGFLPMFPKTLNKFLVERRNLEIRNSCLGAPGGQGFACEEILRVLFLRVGGNGATYYLRLYIFFVKGGSL